MIESFWCDFEAKFFADNFEATFTWFIAIGNGAAPRFSTQGPV